jgi:hypothetical protein
LVALYKLLLFFVRNRSGETTDVEMRPFDIGWRRGSHLIRQRKKNVSGSLSSSSWAYSGEETKTTSLSNENFSDFAAPSLDPISEEVYEIETGKSVFLVPQKNSARYKSPLANSSHLPPLKEYKTKKNLSSPPPSFSPPPPPSCPPPPLPPAVPARISLPSYSGSVHYAKSSVIFLNEKE